VLAKRPKTVFTLARFLPRAVPLLVVVAMMPAPIPAAAWAAPPSLNGEHFAGSGTITPSCGILVGTFGFNVPSGSATGSYLGSFSETGSVTITGISVTGFTASFTIKTTSGAQNGDIVVGTKAWAPPPGDFGLCVEGIALHVHSSYRGTITLITAEKFCDTGTAVTSFGTNGLGSITEDFTSSKTTAGKCA
jgi:hypothetical protein